MNKKELEGILRDFHESGKDASDLNLVRTEIFDCLDNGKITNEDKDGLLKDLYSIASNKGIFFLKVTERTPGLPKTEDDIESEDSYEESYEESYEDDDADVGGSVASA